MAMSTVLGELTVWQTDRQTDGQDFSFIYIDIYRFHNTHGNAKTNVIKYELRNLIVVTCFSVTGYKFLMLEGPDPFSNGKGWPCQTNLVS